MSSLLHALQVSPIFSFIDHHSAELFFFWMSVPAMALLLLPKRYGIAVFTVLCIASMAVLGFLCSFITLAHIPLLWMACLALSVAPTYLYKEDKKILTLRWIIVFLYIAFYFYISIVCREPETLNAPDPWSAPSPFCSGLNATDMHPIHFETFKREYTKMHREMMAGPKSKQRLLIYEPGNFGLGNRLQAILSAFVLAASTNRAFLLHWKESSLCDTDARDLFQDVDFGWHLHNYSDVSLSGRDVFRMDFEYKRSHPLRWGSTFRNCYNGFVCDADLGIPEDKRIVHLKSNQWFLPALMHNEHHRYQVCKTFGNVNEIFGRLSRWLLVPLPEIQDVIDSVKEKHFKDNTVIGIQIRANEKLGVPKRHIPTFHSCATFLSDEPTTRYFLATDSGKVRQQFRIHVGDRLIDIPKESFKGLKPIAMALVDMWLLGESNEIIASPGSTFGAAGFARTGVVPHVVNNQNQCVRMLTSQPCFHYYFGMFRLKCWTAEKLKTDMLNHENCFV